MISHQKDKENKNGILFPQTLLKPNDSITCDLGVFSILNVLSLNYGFIDICLSIMSVSEL